MGSLVEEELYARILAINEAAQKSKNDPGSISQKIGDFWSSAMNVDAINAAGLAPLKADLAKIDKIQSASDLSRIAADFHNEGVACFFNAIASQDDKASDQMIYTFYQ